MGDLSMYVCMRRCHLLIESVLKKFILFNLCKFGRGSIKRESISD